MENNNSKFVFWVILSLLIIVSFLIIKDYITTILTSFVLAYLIKPVFDRIKKKTGKSVAGILSTISILLIILIILIIPLGLVVGKLGSEAYQSLRIESLKPISENLASSPLFQALDINVKNLSVKASSYVLSIVESTLASIPSLIISFLILVMGIYYILINWDNIASLLKKYIPFKDKERITKGIKESTRGIIYGTIIIAIIQFLVAAIGFYILGINNYILLSILIGFMALIPAIGPAIVWIPTVIFYFIIRNYTIAIGVLVLGLFLSIVIDAIVRSKLIGAKAKMNPFILILGIIGGVTLLGIIGFVIGPLVLVYTIELLKELKKE